jgi:hypothetical protein
MYMRQIARVHPEIQDFREVISCIQGTNPATYIDNVFFRAQQRHMMTISKSKL